MVKNMEYAENFILVISSINNQNKAAEIAKEAVKQRLAACCSVTNSFTSFFVWEDNFEQSNEYYMVFKTEESKLMDLEIFIKSMHSDIIPEILSFKIYKGSENYLNWMREYIFGG